MSLEDIVKALGGELHGRGRAVIPGPGHGPADRSVSLMVEPGGRLIVHSFGRSDWREVVDDLRRRRFIDAENRISGQGVGAGYCAPLRVDADKISAARALWRRGVDVACTLSERYIRSRAVLRPLPGPDVLRHVSAAPIRAYDGEGPFFPAMLAAIRDLAGDLTAVEITYLDSEGGRHKRLRTPKKFIGVVPEGAAVRLDPLGPDMLVGEGVFTVFSASERFSRPGWALLSTSRMPMWTPPEGVRSVLIAGDNGRGGRRAARLLSARLRGLEVHRARVFPDLRFDDFNTEAKWSAVERAPG